MNNLEKISDTIHEKVCKDILYNKYLMVNQTWKINLSRIILNIHLLVWKFHFNYCEYDLDTNILVYNSIQSKFYNFKKTKLSFIKEFI